MSKRGALRFSSLAAMPDSMRRLAEPKYSALDAKARAHSPPVRNGKYGNNPTTRDGIRFDSKREAVYYEQLRIRQKNGDVLFFLRQVPFHLPGGTKLVVDFLEFHSDGTVHVVDAKGMETPIFRLKRREVEHHYPVKIELV